MRKSRFTEAPIVAVLHEGAAVVPVRGLYRRNGIAEQTYYRWKAPYGGPQISETKKLKAIEEENRRLKRIVADQVVNLQVLKDVMGREWCRPSSGGAPSRTRRTPPR